MIEDFCQSIIVRWHSHSKRIMEIRVYFRSKDALLMVAALLIKRCNHLNRPVVYVYYRRFWRIQSRRVRLVTIVPDLLSRRGLDPHGVLCTNDILQLIFAFISDMRSAQILPGVREHFWSDIWLSRSLHCILIWILLPAPSNCEISEAPASSFVSISKIIIFIQAKTARLRSFLRFANRSKQYPVDAASRWKSMPREPAYPLYPG